MDDDATLEDRLRSALTTGVETADAAAGEVVPDRVGLDRRITSHRRRQRATRAVAVGVVVAVAAAGGWAVGQGGGDPGRDVERVAGTTTTAAPATTAAEIVASGEPVPVVAADSVAEAGAPPPSASGPTPGNTATMWFDPGPTAERPSAPLFTRTLPDGTQLDVRGNRFDPVGFDIPPFWDPPGWCLPAGDVYVGIRLPAAVGQVTGVRYDDVRPGEIVASVTIVGEPEGHPQWVVVAQAPAAARTIRATFPGGGSDEVELTDGLAVLTAPRASGELVPDASGILPGPEVVAVDEAGGEVARDEVPWTGSVSDGAWAATGAPSSALTPYGPNGPAGSADDCAPPETLPAPGAEQPADPAAAEAEVRATWEAAVGQPVGTPAGDLFEDPTGLEDAQRETRESQGDELLDSVDIPIDAVVFADADTAYVQYGVHVRLYDIKYYGRFAELVRVDGRWKVTRASVCRLLSLGGGTCEPLDEGEGG